MGLFSNLMNSIFHAAGKAERPADAYEPGQSNPMRATPVTGTGIDAATGRPNPAPAAAPAATAASQPAGTAAAVDIESVLNGMAATHKEKLDWRHSIVDLMKLVGMESSLTERKELAKELGYTGDSGDSAKMNMWLHKEVMRKLAENGGKVPADLLD
jgi:hypothetical protein